jgi:hypothetical protein
MNKQKPTISIQYCFRMEDGQEDRYHLNLDPETMEIVDPPAPEPPPWTDLAFHQCPNCPLDNTLDKRCPAAENMVTVVNQFAHLLSYEKTLVIVITAERIIYSRTTVQRGVCSLLGLLMACSACPLMAFFKPMARFHLPFASTEETIWRATSSYLLTQYFLKISGVKPDIRFEGLAKIYNEVQKVNMAFAKRLQAACEEDSMVNAIILLDMFAKSMPSAIEESLDEIRHLFTPYLNHVSTP